MPGAGYLDSAGRMQPRPSGLRLGDEKNFPVAPVNAPKTIADDAGRIESLAGALG